MSELETLRQECARLYEYEKLGAMILKCGYHGCHKRFVTSPKEDGDPYRLHCCDTHRFKAAYQRRKENGDAPPLKPFTRGRGTN